MAPSYRERENLINVIWQLFYQIFTLISQWTALHFAALFMVLYRETYVILNWYVVNIYKDRNINLIIKQ